WTYSVAVVSGVILGVTSLTASAKEFISIGGGGTGGTFNTLASGVASRMNDTFDDVRFTVEGSAGSTENIRRIGSGDLQMGITFTGDSYLAANGLEDFAETGTVDNVRFLGFVFSAVSQLVTTADSGIESIADLEGHRISVGSAGSGTAQTMDRILEYFDLEDRVSTSYINGSQSSDQLRNGQLDAYHGQWGVPAGAIVDTTSSLDAKLISTYDELKDADFFDAYPFYSEAIIPAGSYSGIDYDVKSIRDIGILVASEDVSDDLAYRILESLYSEEGLEHMRAVSNTTREMSLENGVSGGNFIPLHPGAEQFWRDQGIELPQ
ncbi:TAXI family TRAP transporter solute-binding subunit, partial [Halomonas sp.]